MHRMSLAIVCLLSLTTFLHAADATRKITRAWYTPAELLSQVAERDGTGWALPETLAGRALVGGDEATAEQLLDQACQQWKLSWTRSNDILVVHRPEDALLDKCKATDLDAALIWQLGWSRDARAIPLLAGALASDDPAISLAAAQAIEVLDTMVPLGRDERVDPLPQGRVGLAAAFRPEQALAQLLDSPYPPLRAAALRLLLDQGGAAAEEAQRRTAGDTSAPVRRVWMQVLTTPPEARESRIPPLLPTPPDAVALKAACDKMVAELPGLEKQSAWEQMQWRVQSMAQWSRQGHADATAALLSLCETKIQHGWFPGWVQRHLAATGDPKVASHLKEIFSRADRASLVRGLEQSRYGEALLEFTRPYLDEQALCYVTARKSGREALDDILPLAEKGNFAAIDALGVIGGPRAVTVLAAQFQKTGKESGTIAFRSGKALARSGSLEAIEALLSMTKCPTRDRRHAATLFLGQIGGPQATARLRELLEKDGDRLIRAAAADALEQLGDADSRKVVAAFRKSDAALPKLVHRPRNERFNEDFPINQWVNLKIDIQAYAEFGEIGWNYDAANRLFFRYGGCSGYTNELTVFDLGTERFQQRRPNEEMTGWGDRRPSRGCSGGRCFDPHNKLAWIGPVIGGGDADLAIAEYYNKGDTFHLGSYDLASDRFRAAARVPRVYGEPAQRYASDWQRGLVYPVKFSPFKEEKPFWALEARSENPYAASAWTDKTTKDEYPRAGSYCVAAVDQASGLLVLYVPPKDDQPPQTWTFDPTAKRWTNMQPKQQPQAQAGAGFVYDPFHKLLLLQGGKEVTQYGGADDSITWTYDLRTNTWTDLQARNGPGNPWVGAMDFDPEHNVFVLFNNRGKQVWAYRYQAVPMGTETSVPGKPE